MTMGQHCRRGRRRQSKWTNKAVSRVDLSFSFTMRCAANMRDDVLTCRSWCEGVRGHHGSPFGFHGFVMYKSIRLRKPLLLFSLLCLSYRKGFSSWIQEKTSFNLGQDKMKSNHCFLASEYFNFHLTVGPTLVYRNRWRLAWEGETCLCLDFTGGHQLRGLNMTHLIIIPTFHLNHKCWRAGLV